ncbi:putative BRCT domain-containing protein [Dioscorea sansibarensis]
MFWKFLSLWQVNFLTLLLQVKSTKFLFGCAINTWMLNADWILDSVEAGLLLTPRKYVNRPIQACKLHHLQGREPILFNNGSIFDKFAVMVYGKARFCTKFSKIIKCGGGLVYKSLQQLIQSTKDGKKSIGAILVEDESSVSRHLKQCILEQNLQMMTANWIINCLFSGKLLPFKKNQYASFHRIKMPTFPQDQTVDMSQEI